MNLSVAAGLLKKTGIMIDTALGAKPALEMTARKEYDVLFIDDRMPGMGGIEMLKALRNDPDDPNREKPCIVLTANAIAGAKDKYIKDGFEDYLSKPIDAAELEKMLLRYLPSEKVVISRERTHAGESPVSHDTGSALGSAAAASAETNENIEQLKEFIGSDDKLMDAVQQLMMHTRK